LGNPVGLAGALVGELCSVSSEEVVPWIAFACLPCWRVEEERWGWAKKNGMEGRPCLYLRGEERVTCDSRPIANHPVLRDSRDHQRSRDELHGVNFAGERRG
jgi:hypothetical protein